MAKYEHALVIDFETANPSANSACAVGLVLTQAGKIIEKKSTLIKPPRSWFAFTHIHGITAADVEDAPTFPDVYDQYISPMLSTAQVLVAHNSSFDKRVLLTTAEHYGIEVPALPWKCTVQLSRNQLRIYPANLKNVCQTLDIPLNHHEALSDAVASAHIYLYANTGEKTWL